MEQSLGKRISENRKRLGLTQDQLAERLGVTAQAVSKWENDQSCPDINTLPRLAEIFGISVDALLGRSSQTVHEAEIVDDEPEGFHVEKDGISWDVNLSGSKKLFPIGFAVFVLLTGCLSVASVVFKLDVSIWSIAWPMAFLVFGLFRIFSHFSFFSLGCSLFGCYFLLNNLNILKINLGSEIVVPIILVLLGLSLLVDALQKPKKIRKATFRPACSGEKKHTGKCETSGTRFSCSTSFGSDRHAIILDKMAEGDAECSFGELTVNLSGVSSVTDSCELNASCSFGELCLQIPRRYRIEANNDASFGSVNIQGHPDAEPAGVIHLNADVDFGEILVQYI